MIRAAVLFVVLSSPAVAVELRIPDTFDTQIKAAAAKYLPGVGWHVLKAQYIAESSLNPMAVSISGAAGLAQFMPATWLEVSETLGFENKSPFNVDASIEAGAYYIGELRKKWIVPRPEHDLHSLALASYNAGIGSLLKAQALCGGTSRYEGIINCLPQVTGRYSTETINYVARIWRLTKQLQTRT